MAETMSLLEFIQKLFTNGELRDCSPTTPTAPWSTTGWTT